MCAFFPMKINGFYYVSLKCEIRENLESLRMLVQSMPEVQDLLFSF